MKTITYAGKSYEKYALPRILSLEDVAAIGKYKGLLVMAEEDSKERTPDIIWIPHCATMGAADFQAYQLKK